MTRRRPGASPAALAALAATVAAAGSAWSSALTGPRLAVAAGLTSAASVAVVAATRRAGLGLAARSGVGVAAAVVVAAAVAEPGAGPGALGAVVGGLRHGWAELLSVTLPAEATGAPLTTLVAVLWLAGAVAAELGSHRAFGRLAPLAAPGAALVAGLAFGASGRPVSLAVPLAFALAAGAWLLLTRPGPDPAAAGGAGAGRVVVGAAALAGVVAAAALVGPALPGADGEARADPRRLHRPPVELRRQVNPLATLTASVAGPDVTAFRVALDGPATRWRLAVLDRFDGSQWTSTAPFQRVGGPLLPPDRAAAATELTQIFELVAHQGALLPAAADPVEISGVTVVVDANGVLAVADSGHPPGGYRVVSAVPVFQPAEMRNAEAAPRSSTGGVLDGDQVPDAVREEAITATAGARSSFGALAALQEHFRSGRFTYDDGHEAPTGHGLFQVAQLLDERKGTAEQFASAFAVMADGLGYRARVVVGYLPGRATAAPHVVEVSARHAHAWPEVLFDDLGWVPFEPSPLDRRAVPAGPDEEAVDAPATDAVQAAVTEEVADQQRPSPVTAPGAGDGPDDQPAVPGGTEGDRSWAALAVAVGLGALAAVLVAPAAVVALKELRRRRRRTGSPGARVAGAWAEALDRLAEGGLVVSRSMVAEEVADRAARLPAVPPAATTALAGLAALANRARFAPTEASLEDAAHAWSRAGEVAAAMRSARSRLGRLRLAVDPRPLRPRARSAYRRARPTKEAATTARTPATTPVPIPGRWRR